MKIVASNSLTLSKVNDGTITHTAWSYSADGTDGFTTVYPNLNLLVNSSAKTKAGFFKDFDKVENGYGEVTRKGNNSYAGISMWDSFSIQPGDYKPGDIYTMSMDVMFTSWNFPAGVYLGEFWIGQRYTHNSWKRICYIELPKDPSKMLNQWIRITQTSTIPPHEDPSVGTDSIFMTKFSGSGEASFTIRIRKPKQEQGSIATPYMQSASEVITADWPKYRGEYSDMSSEQSTNPSNYTWTIVRGNDGTDGVSPTVTVNPDTSLTIVDAKGTSKTPALKGADGTDGTSGIIVSSVAPDSPQNGQLWQDTSTTPQLVKKWTGSEWVIWKMYVENMNVNNLSALSTILGDIDGGTLKLMADDMIINGQPKMYGIYQSKLGLLSSGPIFDRSAIVSDTQMSVASLNKGELRFMATDYTEDLKNLQESGMSDQNNAFIKFNSYENGKDVMLIGSSGDIVFKGNTSQDTPWITLSSGVKYKFMFSRVYISVDVVGDGNSFMQFGTLPQNLRPISDQFLIIANQGAGTADDRHIMVRASDGAVVLWTPKSGITYRGEVSYTL